MRTRVEVCSGCGRKVQTRLGLPDGWRIVLDLPYCGRCVGLMRAGFVTTPPAGTA